MKKENINWGCRRISDELAKLNIIVSKSKVAEILIKHGLDPTDYGLTWSKFLKSHIESVFAMDFKVVTTLFGKTYYLLFFISHFSRKIIHYNITDYPTKKWIELQLRNFSFNFDFDKKIYLIRDNDQLYKYIDFQQFNIEDVPISRQAPDMNAIMERFIGSFKREALNFFVIINRKQLEYIAKTYVYFYNYFRPHQGIGNVTIPEYLNIKELKIYSKYPKGKIMKQEFLNGILNHYYYKHTA
jgi:transposase InsO family protein